MTAAAGPGAGAGAREPGQVPDAEMTGSIDDTTTGESAEGAGAIKWVSRIHVADICGVLMASMALPPSRQPPVAVYNVADLTPAPRAEVLDYAASLLGIDRGSYQDPGRGARRTQRARSENKRVRSSRLAEVLGYRLAYPDYRTGLASLVGSSTEPPAPGADATPGVGEGER